MSIFRSLVSSVLRKGFILLLLPARLWAQHSPDSLALPNDLCETALQIEPGTRLISLSNEKATVGPITQTPHGMPATCIESFENDLWFRFKTLHGQAYYKIIITTIECNTPAGLQALLLETPKCDANKYSIVGCSNQESMDTILMTLHQPEGGRNYYIYVDGFDGTICEFTLAVEVAEDQVLTPQDYARMKWDYEIPEETLFEPDATRHEWENNQFTMRWKASNDEDIDFFLIEQLDVEFDRGRGFIRGIVGARTTVAGGEEEYTFTDYNGVRVEMQHCYKIVAVMKTGERRYSADFCFTPHIVNSFFVHDVSKGDLPGIYTVSYMNNVNKADYLVSVENESGEKIKKLELENEPVRDGKITIDMTQFPPGTYYFIMQKGSERFRREFVVDGK